MQSCTYLCSGEMANIASFKCNGFKFDSLDYSFSRVGVEISGGCIAITFFGYFFELHYRKVHKTQEGHKLSINFW